MSELRYVFNVRKTTLADAKAKMQTELFQGSNATGIFDEIWRNAVLRESLFGVIPVTLLLTEKPNKRLIYDGWVTNLNDKIFILVDVN
jgi:hypothetical protein